MQRLDCYYNFIALLLVLLVCIDHFRSGHNCDRSEYMMETLEQLIDLHELQPSLATFTHNLLIVNMSLPLFWWYISSGWWLLHAVVLCTYCSYTRMYSSTVLFRNLLFAPITEEVVYRAVIIATLCVTSIATVQQPTQEGEESTLLVINGIDGINYGTPLPWVLSRPVPMALFSTLFFGVAHAHHLVEKISNGTPVPAAMVSTIVQLTYTSIFGFIAAILFMRTGNIYCPIISHQICNLVGLPNLGFLQSNGRGSQSNEYACLYEYRHILMFLHAAGLVLFTFLLLPLTEGLAEVSLYWHRA